MRFTREQQHRAYTKLPEDVRDFILSSETTDLITEELTKLKLTDEQAESADSEVLYVLYGLQNTSDALQNISKASGKSLGELSGLKNTLETKILKKISDMGINLDEFISMNYKEKTSTPPLQPNSGKAMPNNLPEVLPNERPQTVPHVEVVTPPKPTSPPVQLQEQPTEPKVMTFEVKADAVSEQTSKPEQTIQPQQVPAPKPNLAALPTYAEPSQLGPDEDKTKRPDLNFPQSGYSTGNDPYREPLE